MGYSAISFPPKKVGVVQPFQFSTHISSIAPHFCFSSVVGDKAVSLFPKTLEVSLSQRETKSTGLIFERA